MRCQRNACHRHWNGSRERHAPHRRARCQGSGERRCKKIIVGLPRNMDGSEGARAATVRAFVEILGTLTQLPIELYDERMTTMVAYRYLGATETYGKKRRDSVDTLSAEIILQDYLAYEKNKNN